MGREDVEICVIGGIAGASVDHVGSDGTAADLGTQDRRWEEGDER